MKSFLVQSEHSVYALLAKSMKALHHRVRVVEKTETDRTAKLRKQSLDIHLHDGSEGLLRVVDAQRG